MYEVEKDFSLNVGHLRKILEDFKTELDGNAAIAGDFNTPLSTKDRSSKQRIGKDIVALNDTPDQMGFRDIYRTFLPKEAIYTLFSDAHRTFPKTDHMVRHKTSLNRFKKR